MKTFLGAVAIALVIIVGGIGFNMAVDHVSGELMSGCEKVTESVKREDAETAKRETEKISKYMEDKKMILGSIIDHTVIGDIELCVSELKGCLDENMMSGAYVRCEKLRRLLTHLPANYKVNLQNIL